jgi:hypothetical protein
VERKTEGKKTVAGRTLEAARFQQPVWRRHQPKSRSSLFADRFDARKRRLKRPVVVQRVGELFADRFDARNVD